MISIGKLTSVEQAVRYLREAIADQRIDYYTVHGESPGRWHGQGADALGLHGEVTDADFAAVLAGNHPRDGTPLGRHWVSSHVVAFDLAVSAPKDVSILYALSDEQTRAAIMRIHGEGVRAAAEYLQDQAGWARQYNPATKRAEPVRARLLMPEFVHRTARPVTDPVTGQVTVDPQLHTHVTVPNWAQRMDGSWGQLYSEPIYKHAATAGAIAQAEWRDRLVRELGISTIVDGKGCFSIVGITESQRREFSRRSQQIDTAAAAFGLESPRGREVAALDTRESKSEVAATGDIVAQWRHRAAGVGLDAQRIRELCQREPGALLPRRLDLREPGEIVGERGLTAHAATFTRRDLLRTLAAHAPLGMSRAQLEATADGILADAGAVVMLPSAAREGETSTAAAARWVESGREVRYSTPEILGLEQRMVDLAQARRHAAVGVATDQQVAAAIAARSTLTRDQKAMITAVCQSPAGVVVITGAAGVGKTYALEACREAFEASGISVVGCAVAGKAAQGLEEGSAIPSWTVASLLGDDEPVPIGGVLIVDEAGMIGDRQMAALMDAAAQANAKLVLVGDPAQLQPIDAGSPMRMLSEHIGTVQVAENVRHAAAWERATLALMRNGDAKRAYNDYVMHGRMHIAESAGDRTVAVISDHRKLSASGVDAIILARRRDAVAVLNEHARAAAVMDGRVHGPALTVGDKEYQVGDRVLCLANDHRGDITNGTRGVVTAVDVERATLTLERPDHRTLVIDTTRYDALDRGYALTVHKAQGMTADVVLVVGSDGATREWTYTAMSRGMLATHYYDVATPPERHREGVERSTALQLSVEERIVRAWERSEAHDTALDYPDRYETPAADVEAAAPDMRATGAQRELLDHLGAPELDQDATWIDASLEIDRHMGRERGSSLWNTFHALGYSDQAIHAILTAEDPMAALNTVQGIRHSPVGVTADGTPTLDARLSWLTESDADFEPSREIGPSSPPSSW